MVFDKEKQVFVTGTSGFFDISDASYSGYHLALGGYQFQVYGGGENYGPYKSIYIGKAAYNAGAGSDKRLKKNIKTIAKDFSRALIRKIRPVSFEYRKNQDYGNEHGIRYGLIAQELREVLDELGVDDVNLEYERFDGYRTVEYKELIAHLINANQDLYDEIDALKQEVAELKARIK